VPTRIPTRTRTPTKTATTVALSAHDGVDEGAAESTTYRIVRGGRSANSGNSRAAVDGDPTTAWVTDSAKTPDRAFVWFDLGRTRSIGEIRWLLSEAVPGVVMTVEVSSDRKDWVTVATVSDFSKGDWQRVETEVDGRYVRFTFVNPEGVAVIGYLAEVQIAP
jgi:hypothetical protein